MSETEVARLPDSIALAPFRFVPLDGPDLYDRVYPPTRGAAQ
jgi:hypothetical protein